MAENSIEGDPVFLQDFIVTKNFAAGMSGGIAYVLDEDSDLYMRMNKELVSVSVVSEKADILELKNMMYTASMANGGPFIIRYPRGCGEDVPWKTAEYELMPPGHGQRVVEGRDIAVIAAGPSVWRAREAIEDFSKEKGWTPSLYNIRYIKPIDEDLLKEACAGRRTIITIEDPEITNHVL